MGLYGARISGAKNLECFLSRQTCRGTPPKPWISKKPWISMDGKGEEFRQRSIPIQKFFQANKNGCERKEVGRFDPGSEFGIPGSLFLGAHFCSHITP